MMQRIPIILTSLILTPVLYQAVWEPEAWQKPMFITSLSIVLPVMIWNTFVMAKQKSRRILFTAILILIIYAIICWSMISGWFGTILNRAITEHQWEGISYCHQPAYSTIGIAVCIWALIMLFLINREDNQSK